MNLRPASSGASQRARRTEDRHLVVAGNDQQTAAPAWMQEVDTDLHDLTERLHPVVEQVLLDTKVASTPSQLERVVAQLALELRRDLGVT